ncbi:hypothetical protein EVAR_81548_1 [Eumeta japonica]|uniref:Uncharacterized protein n=1 Tax=Eumeta variegata TaxID=151549 RepID=A0A4C1V0N1_EUMVA|nr:hypothetical protein EVAR_81548_1 [Eumeta japonica]
MSVPPLTGVLIYRGRDDDLHFGPVIALLRFKVNRRKRALRPSHEPFKNSNLFLCGDKYTTSFVKLDKLWGRRNPEKCSGAGWNSARRTSAIRTDGLVEVRGSLSVVGGRGSLSAGPVRVGFLFTVRAVLGYTGTLGHTEARSLGTQGRSPQTQSQSP